MVRGDIVGGLKIALSQGEKLQQVMQSFYNAGYKKEEIIEAAKELKLHGFVPKVAKQPLPKTRRIVETKIKSPKTIIQPKPINPPVAVIPKPSVVKVEKKEEEKSNIPPPAFAYGKPQPHAPIQTQPQAIAPKQVVSAYAQPQKSKLDFTTILLAVILFLLVGVLVGVFFFKVQIIELLEKILD